MSRGKGVRKPCDVQQARHRLVDATEATSCVRWARQLLVVAEARFEA